MKFAKWLTKKNIIGTQKNTGNQKLEKLDCMYINNNGIEYHPKYQN